MEPVVLDVGSGYTKAGYANPDNEPPLVLRTALVPAEEQTNIRTLEHSPSEDSPSKAENLRWPVQRGEIVDWDAIEDFWHYILYNQLGWEEGNEGQVLYAEPLFTSKTSRERLAQVMFENFNVSGLYILDQAVLSLYATGRLSGCAIDVGFGKIDIVPVIEGAVLHSIAQRISFGGKDLTGLFENVVKEADRKRGGLKSEQNGTAAGNDGTDQRNGTAEGNDGTDQRNKAGGGNGGTEQRNGTEQRSGATGGNGGTEQRNGTAEGNSGTERRSGTAERKGLVADFATAERMKEKYAAVAEDAAAYVRMTSGEAEPLREEHTLPDGQVISVGRERYTVGEALFRPSLVGLDAAGIADATFRAIMAGPQENQRQFLENVVLCGGSSLIPGLEARLLNELVQASPPSIRPLTVKPPEYMPDSTLRHSAWMGGAIVAKVVFPQNQHITKAEYNEHGPFIVHKQGF